MQRERQSIGGSRADQWRATDLHGADGVRGCAHTRQGDDFPLAGQTSLIDDLDRASGKRRAQGLDVGRFHKLLVKRIAGRLNRALLDDLDDIVEVIRPEPQVFAHRDFRRGFGDLWHLE